MSFVVNWLALSTPSVKRRMAFFVFRPERSSLVVWLTASNRAVFPSGFRKKSWRRSLRGPN